VDDKKMVKLEPTADQSDNSTERQVPIVDSLDHIIDDPHLEFVPLDHDASALKDERDPFCDNFKADHGLERTVWVDVGHDITSDYATCLSVDCNLKVVCTEIKGGSEISLNVGYWPGTMALGLLFPLY